MTPYERACAVDCTKWCAKGNVPEDGWHYRFIKGRRKILGKCSAPDRDQFEAQLVQEIRVLEARLLVKETLLAQSSKFILGAGYTGPLSNQAGADWKRSLEMQQDQTIMDLTAQLASAEESLRGFEGYREVTDRKIAELAKDKEDAGLASQK